VVRFTLFPLYPQGNSPRYPVYRRLGGSQNRSGRHGEVKINIIYFERFSTNIISSNMKVKLVLRVYNISSTSETIPREWRQCATTDKQMKIIEIKINIHQAVFIKHVQHSMMKRRKEL
jgi:hypothetical protein